MTFNATGGKLSDNRGTRTDAVSFTTTELNHSYQIGEPDPYWDSHVFNYWTTTPADDPSLDGYFKYKRGDTILFYCGEDGDSVSQGVSKGSITLYAQWEEVVCKITDRDGTLLYVNGSPAVYGTLEEGFEAYNTVSSFYYRNGGKATPRRIEMLVGECTLNAGVTLARGRTALLTTAPKTDTDGYAYTGDAPECVITRGETCTGSMITNYGNLSLQNVTLDGGSTRGRKATGSGGLINDAQTSAVLTVYGGTTLRNSSVSGSGGAVYVVSGASMTMSGGTIRNNSADGDGAAVCLEYNGEGKGAALTLSGGTISGNHADRGGAVFASAGTTVTLSGGTIQNNTSDGDGAGICLDYDSATGKAAGLELSGSPLFAGNTTVKDGYSSELNGGQQVYTNNKARQDVFLSQVAAEGHPLTAITLTGNLSAPRGSIWAWAEGGTAAQNHYYMLRQFAVLAADFPDEVTEATYRAFRNARTDDDTDCGSEFLTGQPGDDVDGVRCIYWTGGFDFSFLKVDGFGAGLGGAAFALYTEYTSAADNKPYLKNGEPVTAVSSAEGDVQFLKAAPKVYYMVETAAPENYKKDPAVYRVTVDTDGSARIERKLAEDEYEDACKGADGKYRLMNVSEASRRVVLRKMGDDGSGYQMLRGAQFRIYRADMTELEKDRAYGSVSAGIWFSGEMNYGKYYLLEALAPASPEGYGGNAGNVYVLEVGDSVTLYETPAVNLAEDSRYADIADLPGKFKKWFADTDHTAHGQ